MSKSVVFISHITPEKEIAITFKELIETSFLGMIDVFVSSDENSISMGQKWLDSITNALKKCSVEIVICSTESIKRPWINFEAGAAWIRDIPVIPLCHSGMEPSKLPVPLNMLQAATANQISSLNLIFSVLASAIGSTTPKVNFNNFITKVVDFENRYTFWNLCNGAFVKLHNFHPELINALRSIQPITLDLTETQISKFEEFMPILMQHNILRFQREEGTKMTTTGIYHPCLLIPMDKLQETLNDPNFRI